jgi:phosphatidylserine/phosphatidylglycerophosphate/cardiolipin synthase-like enzyme
MTMRTAIAGLLAALLLAGCVHLPDAARIASGTDRTSGGITAATPLDEIVRKRHVRPLDPTSATPLLDQAMTELAKTDESGRFHGITYNLTKDNALDPHWVVQTPDAWGRPAASVGFFPLDCKGACDADYRLPICHVNADCAEPGAVCGVLAAAGGERLCLGHSDAVVDRFYQPIADAAQAVDVTLLQPVPESRFLAALRNGVTALARSGRAVTVRVLVGQYPPDGADAKALLAQLVRDAKDVPGARLAVYAAAMRSCTGSISCESFSWNHAKIVAVDGKTAVVGGHNMYSRDYLLGAPIHDLSMVVHGGAATDAHHYADKLWDYVCDHKLDPLAPVSVAMYRSGAPALSGGCLEKIPLPQQSSAAVASVAILASGRLGSGITSAFANQDDLARDLIFGAARHDILVAQQDLGFLQPGQPAPIFPEPTLAAWVDFLLAGRGDVFVVLSNPGSHGPSGGDYSNGVKLAEVPAKMLAVAQARSALSRPQLVDLLCAHLHVAPYRFGPDATWPDNQAIGNHSKFWMVDDRYFYIGSDNLYPVDLQEFGYIVDDRAAAAELRRVYWDKLWRWSRAAAISGNDAPACGLRAAP